MSATSVFTAGSPARTAKPSPVYWVIGGASDRSRDPGLRRKMRLGGGKRPAPAADRYPVQLSILDGGRAAPSRSISMAAARRRSKASAGATASRSRLCGGCRLLFRLGRDRGVHHRQHGSRRMFGGDLRHDRGGHEHHQGDHCHTRKRHRHRPRRTGEHAWLRAPPACSS